MAHVLTTQVELKVSAKVLWKAYALDGHELLPKVVPQVISKIETLEGDGKAGTIRLVHFGPAMNGIPSVKEKVEVFDEDKLTITVVGIEGGMIGTILKFSKVTTTFVDGAVEGTCIVHWKLEVEPLGELGPPPVDAEQGAIGTFKALEAYLLSQTN